MEAERKYDKLLQILRQRENLAVAYSGGVDSTLLLYAARQALGECCAALTAASAFFPARESAEAVSFCRENGIRQILVSFDVLKVEGIRNNPKNRCYLCKKTLFGRFLAVSKEEGFDAVAEGSNMDDLGDWRPGLQAIEELGILSPLREAGLTKADIRQLSRRFSLPTFNKPSFACLASRFVYNEEITEEKLRMVEQAEDVLYSAGFTQFRVRIHDMTASSGYLARIEILPEQFELLLREPVKTGISKKLHSFGFTCVSVDLDGYRMGSMNPIRSIAEDSL